MFLEWRNLRPFFLGTLSISGNLKFSKNLSVSIDRAFHNESLEAGCKFPPFLTENPPFSRPHPYGALIRFPRGGGGMLFLLFIESRKNLCLLSVLNSSHSRTCLPENLRACGVRCECNGVLYAMTDEEYY
ncbi:hypothetical protein T4B_7527 [Trichinella pseudospiralis]|uniref:Uncharacterized protein n=1 Tax=Trichinella pseudospiralis TaxID=6337 RepID=A0A0V1GVQ1_TRIPS|nr:hypothetical protein T4B_7527 [Trichinella pseudospiralis]